jgi:cytoskeletal protein RodZ
MNKKKLVIFFALASTVVLSAAAIISSYILYQKRAESVAPTTPESEPAAQEPQITSCQTLNVVIEEESASPSPEASASPEVSPSPSPEIGGTKGEASPTPSSIAQAEESSESPITTPKGAKGPALPEAGIAFPTIIGGTLAIIVILIALILAL